MNKLSGKTAVFAGLSVLLITTSARATDGSGISTELISKGRFGKIDVKTKGTGSSAHQVKLATKGASDVYVVRNTVAPGGHSGWHTHPGPSLITVKSGIATFYDGDDPTCTPRVYTAGMGAIDPGDGHVHILRNEDSVTPLVTVTVQILPAGAERRTDAPDPGNCDF